MAISGNQWQSVAISGDGLTGGHRPEAQLVPQIVRAQHLPYRERTQGSPVAIKGPSSGHQDLAVRAHPYRRTSDEALQSR